MRVLAALLKSEMTKLRGALFGCGMISEFQLRGWRRIAEVEIVALSDSMIERAEDRLDQFYPDARAAYGCSEYDKQSPGEGRESVAAA